MKGDGGALEGVGQSTAVSHPYDHRDECGRESFLSRTISQLEEIQMSNMITIGQALAVALVIGVLFLTLPGCQKEEGIAERAGKQVDQTIEKVGEKIEKAGENIQDAEKDGKK